MYNRVSAVLAITGMLAMAGCAGTMEVRTATSDKVALNPKLVESGKPIFVVVTNEESYQELNFGQLIRDKIIAAGKTITKNPREASYLLQADLLYIGSPLKDMSLERSIRGGFGSLLGGNLTDTEANGSATIGLVDIMIKENVDDLPGVKRETEYTYQNYRTRLGVNVIQYNIDRGRTSEFISSRLAERIAEFFN
jgi:hypothetical protein